MSTKTQFIDSIPFEISGSGPLFILFHSLIADQSSFAQVVPRLAKDFTVAIATLPGFAGTQHSNGDGLHAVADKLAAAIRRLAGGEKPVLLGNGYGGFVALQLVIRHPELIGQLILADAGACFSEPGREAFRNMAVAVQNKGLEAVAQTAMRRLFAPEFMAANPELVAECQRRFLSIDKNTFVTACNTLAALNLRPDLDKVTIPVLALVGEKDEATPPDMSRELVAALPNAGLVVLPNCAHVPQLQSPEQFLSEVLPFVTREQKV